MRLPNILAIVMAGGEGSRLDVLTEKRAKPSLPFGGTYRLIDVSLSNLAHAHISDVLLVEEYLPHTLNRHLANGRPWDLDRSHRGLQMTMPYTGAEGEGFHEGNSDTLFSQIPLIEERNPDLVLVLSADHLYLLNFLDVLDTHTHLKADLTMVTTEIFEDASRFSVVETEDQLVTGFEYKPDEPKTQTVGCEIFIFDAKLLVEALRELKPAGLEDYGDDLLPYFVENHRVAQHKHDGYWVDVGTPQAYWTAHMHILEGNGVRLDDDEWPIWSAQPQLRPAKVTKEASIDQAMISAGTTVSGAVTNSIIGPKAVIEKGASVTNCVVLDGAVVRSGAELTNAIIDIDAEVGPGKRGLADGLSIIDADGLVAYRAAFDYAAELPAFIRDQN